MKTVVQKWGNSLGIRIPAPFARECNISNGSAVDVYEHDGTLVVVPRRLDLETLLSVITAENLHESADTGAPSGLEEW